MKKIKDERLIVKNLQNIRMAYIVQTIGIVGILAYDWITKGTDEMRNNPLWLIFMISTIVLIFGQANISVDYESDSKSPKKGLAISLIILTLVSTTLATLTAMSDGFEIVNGMIIGGILFICGSIPIFYIYYLRKQKQDENVEEE